MKYKNLKQSTVILLILASVGTGCQKEEDLPSNHAKGKIIEVTSGCYGEIVLIEVENPKGIGLSGSFSYPGDENEAITYKNAIGVPYFSKIGIPDSVPQSTGTWLYFEYRELNEEERNQSSLFSPDPPIVCRALYGAPNANTLIITKIIRYK